MSTVQKSADHRTRVNKISWWKFLGLIPLVIILRVYLRTLRHQLYGDVEAVCGEQRPVIFALWHNRALVGTELHRLVRRKRKRLCGLVSASRDGAWLSAVFALLGVATVRGSSSRFGANAARKLIDVVRQHRDIGITIDGPRGPIYGAHDGTALIAIKSGAPIVLVATSFDNYWRLKSWDRFFIPKPFSRVRTQFRFFSSFADLESGSDRRAVAEGMRRSLYEMAPDPEPALHQRATGVEN